MNKKYDISKQSDMNRLIADVTQGAMRRAEQEVLRMNFQHNCPHCANRILVSRGKNICKFCQKEVTLTVNIK